MNCDPPGLYLEVWRGRGGGCQRQEGAGVVPRLADRGQEGEGRGGAEQRRDGVPHTSAVVHRPGAACNHPEYILAGQCLCTTN